MRITLEVLDAGMPKY